MCSLSISGTGNVFGSAHEREIWLKQSKEKEDILILRQASLHFHCLHATHSADSAENRVLPVQDLPHQPHHVPPPLTRLLSASLPRPRLFSHFCHQFFTLHLPRFPSPIPDGASSSCLASFLLSKACQCSDILTISVYVPHLISPFLFLPFPVLLPCLHFSFSQYFCFPPLVSLHAGDWNVSSPCLRSWGGLSLEKYQSNKYSLTVNRSHCKAE